MKKTKSSVLTSLLACSALFASCESIIPENPFPVQQTAETSRLKLCIIENGSTKGSISPNENLIQEICLAIYREEDGRLMESQTVRSAESIEMELPGGRYNIYVTANMDVFNAPASETDMAQICHTVDSFSEMNQTLPMCWTGKADLKPGENTVVYANLERLVSKIGFNVERGSIPDLEIISVRLCQGAGRIRPFMDGGSRILTTAEAMDGDYATAQDIGLLMDGETVYFYVAENCQGTLLPYNKDPWSKIPDNIGEKAGLCTYLEMKCRWKDTADYDGDVTYRFYLGEDAYGNFDIRRNSLHNLTLYMNPESLDRISWKIDTSQMESIKWRVTSDLSQNFHEKDNFYMTEKICLNFRFDENGEEYWDDRDYEFTIAGIDYNGNTIIKFGKSYNNGNGNQQAIGTCIGKGAFDLVLIDSETGKIEYVMDHGYVHVPKLVIGKPGIYADIPVEGFSQELDLWINGASQDICIYLTDHDRNNLHQGHFWECDFSLCEWEIDIISNKYGDVLPDPDRNIFIVPYEGFIERDSYISRFSLSIGTDGRYESWTRALADNLGSGTLTLSIVDLFSGAKVTHPMGLYGEVH